MKKKFSVAVMGCLMAFGLYGCGTHNHVVPRQLALDQKEISEQSFGQKSNIAQHDFLLEPSEALGLEVTPGLKSHKISVYQVILSQSLFSEGSAQRIRWCGEALDEKGNEYFVQALRWPRNKIDINANSLMYLIIEDGGMGIPVNVMYFSSALHWAYDAYGRETQFSPSKFEKDAKWRQDTIRTYGTSTTELKKISLQEFYSQLYFMTDEGVAVWREYTTPDGSEIIAPLTKGDVQEIAGKNPAYSSFQKWIEYARKPIFINPINTGIANVLEIAQANFGNLPSKGWSLSSVITRREAALERAQWEREMQDLISFLKKKLAKLR
jgi:hypothetical protein